MRASARSNQEPRYATSSLTSEAAQFRVARSRQCCPESPTRCSLATTSTRPSAMRVSKPLVADWDQQDSSCSTTPATCSRSLGWCRASSTSNRAVNVAPASTEPARSRAASTALAATGQDASDIELIGQRSSRRHQPEPVLPRRGRATRDQQSPPRVPRRLQPPVHVRRREVIPVPKIVDIRNGTVTYDAAQQRKLPDWTYAPA